MYLDVPTLFVGLTAAEISGCIFLTLFSLFWKQRTKQCLLGVLFWSAGLLVAGCGTYLVAMRGILPDAASIVIANALVILGIGLRRVGYAKFLDRSPHFWIFVAAALIWILLCMYPPFFDNLQMRINYVQSCLILASLWMVWMAFFEKNSEGLSTSKALGLVAMLESACCFWFVCQHNIRTFDSFVAAYPEQFMSWYVVITLILVIMSSVLPACMIIERSLLSFKSQALQDPVTGLLNHRAFLRAANDQLMRDRSSKKAYQLAVLEIEGLDCVREQFGHAMGDALSRLFAHILRDTLDGRVLVARLGAREYGLLFSRESQDFALLNVQRLCRRLGSECDNATGGRLDVAACGGLVTADRHVSLARAMEVSETALHRAKKAGPRQIVTLELAPDGLARESDTTSGFMPMRRVVA